MHTKSVTEMRILSRLDNPSLGKCERYIKHSVVRLMKCTGMMKWIDESTKDHGEFMFESGRWSAKN